MQAEPFERARRFLQFSPWAAWSAIVLSILLALIQVGLLSILGLFLDLIVEKGLLPPNAATDSVWLESLLGPVEAASVQEAIARGEGVGLVSLAYRLHQRQAWAEPLISALASSLEWTRRNDWALNGMLMLGLLGGILWCGLILLMHWLATRATMEAATRLRRAVYHQTYRLGTLAFRALGTSEAIGIFTRYLEAVIEGLYAWMTVVFREPARVLALFLFALMVEWAASGSWPWLTITFVLIALLFWLVEGQLAVYFHRLERRNGLQATEQLALLQESLQMLRLVKCYSMEPFNQSRVERQLVKYAECTARSYQQRALFSQILILLALVAGLILLYAVGWNVMLGSLGVPATITVTVALVCVYWPLWHRLEQQRTLRRARNASTVLFQFLDKRGDVGQVVGAEFLQPLQRQLEFANVSLKEPGTGRVLLEEVSLQIPAGQRVGIVGPDELEKHALVYLIPRFLDPKEGEIRIDGKNLRWVTLESVRLQVALVLQHNLVFNDTVANNIGCGDPNVTLPRILEAAKAAHAHQFIQRLPNGYETRIGELGHTLNVGEQFRIAMARAILRDPALVIIEEPLNPMDDDTKAMVDDTYARFLPERTSIFLPHRLSTIKACDQVFLLVKGRIEAAGVHRELLNQSDLYRHIQYVEFNVFADQF